jgi:alpha-beta hydrolase superfamily lysophospholipase
VFYKPKPAAAAPAPVTVTSAAPAAAAPAKPAAAGTTAPFAVPAGKTSRYSLTVNERRYDATVEILN